MPLHPPGSALSALRALYVFGMLIASVMQDAVTRYALLAAVLVVRIADRL